MILDRIEKWKAEKKKNAMLKRLVDMAAKELENIHNASVKIHVLKKCSLRVGNEEKMIGFLAKKRRGWIILSKTSCRELMISYNMKFCSTFLTKE